jgi:hypothetical protein
MFESRRNGKLDSYVMNADGSKLYCYHGGALQQAIVSES